MAVVRLTQLVREDIRDLTQVQQIDQMEVLVQRLSRQSGRCTATSPGKVSPDTIRRWVAALCDFHLGFLVRPWFRNVSRSFKWYLRDWADIEDVGEKAETFVACHLLKAVDGWNDMGLGRFELGYLRDREKREVDFLVARGGQPWFLVEVKYRDESMSRTLKYHQDQLRVPFAFQVVIDADFVDADCFAKPGSPLVVPAKTFLSQLV